MSADGAAMRAASSFDGTMAGRDAPSDLARTGASANPREVDVLRNSLSAVMVEYHEQSKKFASMAADHARLRARCSELEKRLFDIESSTLWVATRRFRAVFTRHPRLRRLVTTIRLALARHSGAV